MMVIIEKTEMVWFSSITDYSGQPMAGDQTREEHLRAILAICRKVRGIHGYLC